MATARPADVVWKALEHRHTEKGPEWYTALGIVAVAGAAAAVMFENILFGFVILLGALAIAFAAARVPKTLSYTITSRGVRAGEDFFPYTELESYYINESDPRGPELILKSSQLFMPLIVILMPDDKVDAAEAILEERLPHEHLEESLGHKLLEFFGF